MATSFNYDVDFPSLPVRSILSSIISVNIKMMSGQIIPIRISSDIAISQFYERVWKIIPDRIAFQCLDLFREDSDDLLLPTLTPLHPQKNEVFLVFIQVHPHLSLCVNFEANSYCQDRFYKSYEVLVYACIPEQLTSIEIDKSHRKMYDGMYYHPTDQEGRPIPHGPRYKMDLFRFFTHHQLIGNKIATTFYSQNGIEFIVQKDEDEDGELWSITMQENIEPLKRLGDLFNCLPISDKEKSILGQALEEKWSQIISEYERRY
jgi:hypothetical protein